MCQCFGAGDAWGFIRLESTSGMLVPIGYLGLGGVERCQQKEQQTSLTGLPGLCVSVSKGLEEHMICRRV